MDAARRGVTVRVILPSYSDFSGVFYAGRAHYDELLDAGVKLYELESAFLHSKSIVVDGVWSSIGSTNFDWRSFIHNNEISVCVIGERFADAMDRAFAADLEDSREITPAAWKKRGFRERLKELMWLPLQYWL
jgi:cardiolipin synthase